MSARYLRWLIREQIDRAQSLKDAIPDRQRHASLDHSAAACVDALDKQAGLLARYGSLLDGGGGAGAARILKAVKRCTRTIAEIEGYGMPPLHCQSERAVFLNDVVSAMHHETGLPFRCPAASCTSYDCYFSHLPTNTVYAPLSEAEFMLHLPDFYHELGHLLLEHSNHGQEYGAIRAGLAAALGSIDDHYSQQANGMGEGATSRHAQDGAEWAHAQWAGSWIQESFCDLFALFAAGPAYAHSNLHLVSRLDMNTYELDTFARQDHPSGEARMRLLDAGMRLPGHEREADHIGKERDAVAKPCGDSPRGHCRAFPSSCFARLPLPCFRRSGGRDCADVHGTSGRRPGRTGLR